MITTVTVENTPTRVSAFVAVDPIAAAQLDVAEVTEWPTLSQARVYAEVVENKAVPA